MKTFDSFWSSFILITMSLALIILGFFIVFFPEKFSEFYKEKPPKNRFLLKLHQIREEESRKAAPYYLNLRITGMIMIAIAILILYKVLDFLIK